MIVDVGSCDVLVAGGGVVEVSVEDCGELDVDSDVRDDSVLDTDDNVLGSMTRKEGVEGEEVGTATSVEEVKLRLVVVGASVVKVVEVEAGKELDGVLTNSVEVDGAVVLLAAELAAELEPAPAVPEGCTFDRAMYPNRPAFSLPQLSSG